jgi:hypothetical protein
MPRTSCSSTASLPSKLWRTSCATEISFTLSALT